MGEGKVIKVFIQYMIYMNKKETLVYWCRGHEVVAVDAMLQNHKALWKGAGNNLIIL